jgi:2-C-methyl-D-erythritol 4-phosphate cytidylyltransferase
MQEKTCAAVILAAGRGGRFGSEKPKQFHLIEGVPIFIRTLRPFVQPSAVPFTVVIVVVPAAFVSETRRLVARYFPADERIHVITGGKHRIHSYFKAVAYLSNYPHIPATTIVHDAVRPLVNKRDLEMLYAAFLAKKAAVLIVVRSLSESLYTIDGNGRSVCLPRGSFAARQTPNVFNTAVLQRIAQKYGASRARFSATQDIIELFPPKQFIHGVTLEHANFKITHAEDLHVVKTLLKKHARRAEKRT